MKDIEEEPSEFVASGGDRSIDLQVSDHAFDAVAFAIERLVVMEFLAAGADRRNDGLDAVQGETSADPVCIVAFVEGGGLDHVLGIETVVQVFKIATVVGLVRGEVQRHAAVLINGRGVDFGG
jgi:hypothetical protein